MTDCTIEICTLTRNYYVAHGCMRDRREYKTFNGAVKRAKERGFKVMTKEDPKKLFEQNDKKTKIVTNLLSGKLTRIGVNTPLCCDPSSETYWSM